MKETPYGVRFIKPLFIPRPSSFILSSASAYEPLNVAVLILVQRLVCALEDYLAAAEHDDLRVDEAEALALLLEVYLAVVVNDRVLARQILDVVHLVRDEDGRHVFEVAEFYREFADGSSGRRVEARSRLVEHHNLRAADECARDADPSAHAAREFNRHLVDRVFEVDEAEHPTHLLLDLFLRHALLVQAVRDVVVNRERVEERALLKDHADLLAYGHHLGLGVLRDVLAVHDDAARVGLEQPEY